ncbi:unnamed protein product, partial [Ectocarpus sp. 13 AM-2016]
RPVTAVSSVVPLFREMRVQCSVDWCHVTTVEGVGTMRQGLHPVQKRIAEMHGSQCGFCTPG